MHNRAPCCTLHSVAQAAKTALREQLLDSSRRDNQLGILRPSNEVDKLMRRCRGAIPLVLAFGAAGCILPAGQRVEPMPGVVGVVMTSPSVPKRGLMHKRVVAKQEPDLLVAEDGTSCRVGAERYRDVQVGSDELCGWQ